LDRVAFTLRIQRNMVRTSLVAPVIVLRIDWLTLR
jgi:hypothetical protein